MKSILILVGFLAVNTTQLSITEEWTSFKSQNGKSYSSIQEEQYRFGVYLRNKKMIQEHNMKYDTGEVSYHLKMNHFSDKLPEEIIAQMNGFNKSGSPQSQRSSLKFISPQDMMLPTFVDWRLIGAVTTVKDQGSCGSCWAFSTTGSLEGQMFRKTGQLISLSEQNLMDCASAFGTHGCNGGLMSGAFDYIKASGGINSEESYPYEGRENFCRFKISSISGGLISYVDIPHKNEEALKAAVATVGPISIAINAGLQQFVYYGGGVFENPNCDQNTLNHGVLLVGYGTEKGQDYWLIKNSWNTKWGDEGYIKIARNRGNMCGVASMASYPLV